MQSKDEPPTVIKAFLESSATEIKATEAHVAKLLTESEKESWKKIFLEELSHFVSVLF